MKILFLIFALALPALPALAQLPRDHNRIEQRLEYERHLWRLWIEQATRRQPEIERAEAERRAIEYEMARIVDTVNEFSLAFNDFIQGYADGVRNDKKAERTLKAWEKVRRLPIWPAPAP